MSVSQDIATCLKSAGGLACVDKHKLASEPLIPGWGTFQVDRAKLSACIEAKKLQNPRQDQSGCLDLDEEGI